MLKKLLFIDKKNTIFFENPNLNHPFICTFRPVTHIAKLVTWCAEKTMGILRSLFYPRKGNNIQNKL